MPGKSLRRPEDADGARPRELLLLRHGKSSWDSDARSDLERPLAKRGRKDAPRVGAWLRRRGLVPDLVLASPARRARQTALLLLESLGMEEEVVRWDPALYGTGLEAHLRVLAGVPRSARRVLLVGHNPDLEDLLHHLGGPGVEVPEDGKLLVTAAVAILRMPADWGRLPGGCAGVEGILRPGDLSGD